MSGYGLLVFSVVYFLAVAAPGPGVAAILARSLACGTSGAPAFIAGFVVGDLFWFTLAVTGLAALAQHAQFGFVLVKYAGALYLLWLAWRLWIQPLQLAEQAPEDLRQSSLQVFAGGLALTLANPKAMIFFLALLPSVVPLKQLNLGGYVATATVIAVVQPVVLGSYALLAAHARRLFKSPRAVRTLNRSTGAVMACAALAVASR